MTHLAVKTGNPEIVRAVLHSGAPVDDKNNKGWTPLHVALYEKQGDAAVIEMLLIQHGANIKEYHPLGQMPILLVAIQQRKAGLTEALIFSKEVSLGMTDQFGQGALHYAVMEKDEDCVLRLLNAGAEVNARSNNGITPLRIAADARDQTIANLLVWAGANVQQELEDIEHLQCTEAAQAIAQLDHIEAAQALDAISNTAGGTTPSESQTRKRTVCDRDWPDEWTDISRFLTKRPRNLK